MGSVIGQILGFAVGVAISPVPVIAVILMLFSKSAATNSVSFAAGWILGLCVVGDGCRVRCYPQRLQPISG